jgi:hypothetical protein
MLANRTNSLSISLSRARALSLYSIGMEMEIYQHAVGVKGSLVTLGKGSKTLNARYLALLLCLLTSLAPRLVQRQC